MLILFVVDFVVLHLLLFHESSPSYLNVLVLESHEIILSFLKDNYLQQNLDVEFVRNCSYLM